MPPSSTPERLRRALEELGPTFIKLGKLLSTRSTSCRPATSWPGCRTRRQFPCRRSVADRSRLGAPPEDIFATFEGVPVACASIGQAHLATLHDGSQVVVKIRRPDIQALIDTDLDILQNLASRASRRWSRRRELQPGRSCWRSVRGVAPPGLDYLTEGRNAGASPPTSPSTDVHIPGALGDDDLSGADPGAHRRYQGRRPGRARALGSIAGPWRRRLLAWRSAWSSSTASSTPIRIRATCSSSRTVGSG